MAKATTVWLEDETMERLRNYAYTERITVKQAVESAIRAFLEDKHDLLTRPDQRKEGRI